MVGALGRGWCFDDYTDDVAAGEVGKSWDAETEVTGFAC